MERELDFEEIYDNIRISIFDEWNIYSEDELEDWEEDELNREADRRFKEIWGFEVCDIK